MSRRDGHRLVGRRLRAVGLAGVLLASAAAAAAPSGAVAASSSEPATGSATAARSSAIVTPDQATPDQTINAQTDPDAAARALTAGCAPLSNCKLHALSNPNPNDQSGLPFVDVYGPPSILGDVLYNCAPPGGPNAYTALGMSDTRGETTSISEKASVTLQGGLIGFASASLEAWVSSTQASSFAATVATTTQIPVPPGYKGYTTSEVLSAQTSGTYYITQGIHLIAVTNVLLTFPGYQIGDRNDRFVRSTYAVPISSAIGQNYETSPPCNAVNPVTGSGGAKGAVVPGSFKLTFCPAGGRCVTHTIAGPPPAKVRRATAILTRAGRTYAGGSDIQGRIRLHGRRKVSPGKYKLIIRQKPKETILSQHGKRIRAAEQRVEIHIPINVCGNTTSGPQIGQPAFGNTCANG
jgi:hypothetical protein